MSAKEIGRWAWLIALVVAVVGGLLSAFGVALLSADIIVTVVGILAFLGGLLYISQGDRTEFFIVTLVLAAAAAAAGEMFGLGQYITAVLTAAAGVVAAAAAGALLVVVYEWIMPSA
jgi:hypothetical protein